jgi:hypothetical protein
MPDSFVQKLRLDNLYPTMPIGSGGEPDLYNQFMGSGAPQAMFNERNRLSQIGQQAMQPQSQQPRDFQRNPMNVVYNPPPSDSIAGRILGVEAQPTTEYQKGELANRQADLALKKQQLGATQDINQQKVDISKGRADVYDFKAKNPGLKIVAQQGGHIRALNPLTGAVVADLGPTGNMAEADRLALEQDQNLARIGEQGNQARLTEGTRQAGAETLEDMKARHATELATLNNSQKPIGTNRIETVKDAQGNIIGARTVKTDNVLPKPNPNPNPNPSTKTIQMWGPNGEGPFDVPSDKVDDAKKNYQMNTSKPGTPSSATPKSTTPVATMKSH